MNGSELRLDVFTDQWVVVAPGRRAIGVVRPGGLPALARDPCPFCPGHEAETEPTILALGDPWRVRVVANKYPLVQRELHPAVPGARSACGAHEVLIESREHDTDLDRYTPEHARDVLLAIRERLRALEALPGIAAIATFRNRGRRAGSSQPHPHAQIAALSFVPPTIATRTKERDVLLEAIARERNDGLRVIEDADGVVTYCPFASWRAWEVRVVTAEPCARLSALDDARLALVARRLVDVVARLRRVLGDFDYNVLFRDPALGAQRSFFTIDVLPRTGGDAGFELLTGTGVCVVTPEEAASALRAA